MRWIAEQLALQRGHAEIATDAVEVLGCHPRTGWRLIKKVYERMEKESEAERPMLRHQMVRSFRMIAQRALADGNHQAAISAYDRLCKLFGLYDDRLRVTVDGDVSLGIKPDLRRLSDDELEELERLHRLVLEKEIEEVKALPPMVEED